MYENEVVIVIPIYKRCLEWYEEIALRRVVEVLGHYNITFVLKCFICIDFW